MQKLKSQYACWFHSKYKTSGPIWRDRFRSLLIENEAYLFACGKYIENNPVKAGLASEDIDWKYSSARHYMKGDHDSIVDGYGPDQLPMLPAEVDLYDEEVFEKRSGIGSAFFRFQLQEKLKLSQRKIAF